MKRMIFVPAVVVALLAVFAAAPAVAAPVPEVEPNNDLWSMSGPVGPEGVTGTISSADDFDLFRVHVAEDTEVTNTFANVGEEGVCNFYVRFLDETVGQVSLGSAGPGGDPLSETWESEGAEELGVILVVDGDPGCTYTFTVDKGLATGPEPAPAPRKAVPEPNDDPEDARGPLMSGVTYTGVIDDDLDSDWVYLWGNAFFSEVRLISPVPSCIVEAYVYEYLDEFEEEIGSMLIEGPGIDTFFASPVGAKYPVLVEVVGDEGCPWGLHMPVGLVPGPNPLTVASGGPKLVVSLTATRHPDVTLKRRRGLQVTCKVNAAARCRVTATIPRAVARRLRIPLGRGPKVQIASGSVNFLRSGVKQVKLPIRRPILNALIAARRPVTATLEATATPRFGGGKPATATKRIKLGS